MGKIYLTFGDIEIDKHKFYRYDGPIFYRGCEYKKRIFM